MNKVYSLEESPLPVRLLVCTSSDVTQGVRGGPGPPLSGQALRMYFSITPLTSTGSSQATSTLDPFMLRTLEGAGTLRGAADE